MIYFYRGINYYYDHGECGTLCKVNRLLLGCDTSHIKSFKIQTCHTLGVNANVCLNSSIKIYAEWLFNLIATSNTHKMCSIFRFTERAATAAIIHLINAFHVKTAMRH